jgi:hypothetical protein
VFDEINAYEPAGIYYSNWKKTNGEYIVIPNDIKITYFLNNELSHQNSIIRRTLFSHHGLYNEGLHIISDREFFMKECWIYKTPFIHLKTDISLFDTTGIGSTNVEKREKERQIVYKSIFGEFTDLIVSCNRVFCFFLRCYRFIFKRLRLTKTLIKKVFTSKNRV